MPLPPCRSHMGDGRFQIGDQDHRPIPLRATETGTATGMPSTGTATSGSRFRLTGQRVPRLRSPPSSGPPPLLPHIPKRPYYRRLGTPRPPVPLPKDTQILHIQPARSGPSTNPSTPSINQNQRMPSEERQELIVEQVPIQVAEQMGLALTFTDQDEEEEESGPHPRQLISGIAVDWT